MSTWNHRIVQKHELIDDEFYYQVHEAHYNDDNELCAITEQGVIPLGSTVEELEQELNHMLEACKKPILIDGEINFASWDDENKTHEL